MQEYIILLLAILFTVKQCNFSVKCIATVVEPIYLVLCGQTAIFLQDAIDFSISARKNIGSGVVPIANSFLTPPSRPGVLKCLLSLPRCLKMA